MIWFFREIYTNFKMGKVDGPQIGRSIKEIRDGIGHYVHLTEYIQETKDTYEGNFSTKILKYKRNILKENSLLSTTCANAVTHLNEQERELPDYWKEKIKRQKYPIRYLALYILGILLISLFDLFPMNLLLSDVLRDETITPMGFLDRNTIIAIIVLSFTLAVGFLGEKMGELYHAQVEQTKTGLYIIIIGLILPLMIVLTFLRIDHEKKIVTDKYHLELVQQKSTLADACFEPQSKECVQAHNQIKEIETAAQNEIDDNQFGLISKGFLLTIISAIIFFLSTMLSIWRNDVSLKYILREGKLYKDLNVINKLIGKISSKKEIVVEEINEMAQSAQREVKEYLQGVENYMESTLVTEVSQERINKYLDEFRDIFNNSLKIPDGIYNVNIDFDEEINEDAHPYENYHFKHNEYITARKRYDFYESGLEHGIHNFPQDVRAARESYSVSDEDREYYSSVYNHAYKAGQILREEGEKK